MKTFAIISLIVALVLTGCAQAPTVQPTIQTTPEPETGLVPSGEGSEDAISEDATPESLDDVLANATETPTGDPVTGLQNQENMEVTWDHSRDKVVLSATFCCGFSPPSVAINYIPDATLYGDGRIIWTEADDTGRRRVLIGQLSNEQMSVLLGGFTEVGFFGWKELYTSPMSPTDMASKCLFIEANGQAKQVCEYYSGAPDAFHDIYDTVSEGAGVKGKAYVPKRGYLIATPLTSQEEADEQNQVETWNDQETGMFLADAHPGVWIEGAALEQVWDMINTNSWAPFVQDQGILYEITLQIPGLSMTQPPAE